MKPTKILTTEIETDWNKPMWVISEQGTIILTTGAHEGAQFEGISIPDDDYPNGRLSWDWFKKSFKPITTPLTIVISN